MKQIRKLALTAVSAGVMVLGALSSTTASAGVIQLGFILDSSGSIGSGNWTTIRNGLSDAVSTLIPTDSSYELSVVSFSSTASLIVNSVLIDSAATLATVAAQIAAMPFLGSTTNYTAAFNLMYTTLNTGTGVTIGAADATYVNFATDGEPNPAGSNGLVPRQLMIDAGVDNISIEGIGSNLTVASVNFLKNSICFPINCDDTSPYDFPNKGFYLAVKDADAYVDAIKTKIKIVTNQVPEPGSIALVGIALAGLGSAGRKRSAVAA